jgi:hypothetical protein
MDARISRPAVVRAISHVVPISIGSMKGRESMVKLDANEEWWENPLWVSDDVVNKSLHAEFLPAGENWTDDRWWEEEERIDG